MVNWKKLANQAKDAYDKADKDELKRKAEGLKGVAQGSGSLQDKAKAAAGVVTSKDEEAEPAPESSGDASGEKCASRKGTGKGNGKRSDKPNRQAGRGE